MTSFQASLVTMNSQRESCQPEVSCKVHLEDCSDQTKTLRSSDSSQLLEYDSYVTIGLTEGAGPGEGVSIPLKMKETLGDSTSKPDKTSSSMMQSEVDGSSSTDNPTESLVKTTKCCSHKSRPTERSQDRCTCRHSSTDRPPTKSEHSSTSKRPASLQVDPKCVNSLKMDTTAMAMPR